MHCPICDSSLMLSFQKKAARDMLICSLCRHVTWREMPTSEELNAYYSHKYTESHGQAEIQAANVAYYAGHARELAGLVNKSVNDLTIADIGCSYPTFLEIAVKQGCRSALGVDWSVKAREYGEHVGVHVVTPDEFVLHANNELFDVLRYSHTLEHVVDPLTMLTAHLPKLRRGGVLYITQPNFPVFFAGPTDIELKDSVWPNHLHFFSPLSAHCLVDRGGCRVTKFFTVSNEAEAEERYRPIIDVKYAAKKLVDIADLGEPNRGPLNSFPYYSGENSVIYGIKM